MTTKTTDKLSEGGKPVGVQADDARLARELRKGLPKDGILEAAAARLEELSQAIEYQRHRADLAEKALDQKNKALAKLSEV